MRQELLPYLGLALLALLLPATAAGQADEKAEEQPDEKAVRARYQALAEALVGQTGEGPRDPGTLKGRYEGLKDQQGDASRRISVSSATDALDASDSSAAATVRKLAAAIKTNPEGTEAGVVIAPFLLAGSKSLRGLELTVASLEKDLTRLGGSYTWDLTRKLADADYQRLASCPVGDPEKEAERFFIAACTEVVWYLPGGTPARDRARAACGFASAPPMPGLVNDVRQIAQEVRKVPADASLPLERRMAAVALQDRAKEFAEWNFGHPYTCYESQDVEVFFERILWTIPRKKIALSAFTDHFPRKYGFSPDGSSLPHGERSQWQFRADMSRVASGVEWGLGIGFAKSRSGPDDGFNSTLAPSLSIAQAFTLLRERPLTTTDGLLNLDEKGDQPPHLVLGLSANVEIALDLPETQVTHLNKLKVQPYLDFFVNDKLSFRLGIPIKAEIVEKKALEAKPAVPPATEGTPAVPGERRLQWTVPVALVTVLKL